MVHCSMCDSGMIEVEVMVRVTGQEGMMPEQVNVFSCLSCGARWTDNNGTDNKDSNISA